MSETSLFADAVPMPGTATDSALSHSETEVTVAVVDDDPVLAVYLLAVLRAAGHRASWFGDGESAVRALTGAGRHAPPLVLLDLSLPGISGLDVLHALAAAGALAGSRVVMMSASASAAARADARAAGAADFLAKPVLPEHLQPWLVERAS